MKSSTTTDHETIRAWVEARGGKPSIVKSSEKNDSGILRIDFPGYSGEGTLEAISWDQFFDIFDKEGLQFLCQDKTQEGEKSHFNKFIRQDTNAE